MPSQPKPNYQVARRSRWRTVAKMLVSDPWRKLIAIVLATCCWLILNRSLHRADSQRWNFVDNVPVDFHPQAARQNGSEFFFDERSISPQEVSLSVAIDVWNETLPSARDFKIGIQPRGLEFSNDGMRTQPLEGTYTLRDSDILEKPDGVENRNFSPATVTYLWDKIIMKEVPIRLQVNDHLPENLSYRVPDLPTVHVKGPAYLVNQISEIATEAVLLDAQIPGPVAFEEVKLRPDAKFAQLNLGQQSLSLVLEIVDQAKIQSGQHACHSGGSDTSPHGKHLCHRPRWSPRKAGFAHPDGALRPDQLLHAGFAGCSGANL